MPDCHRLPLITLLALCCCSVLPAEEPGQQAALKTEIATTVTLEYQLFLPEGYESQDKWPLLLFLHGSGERGSDVEKVKVHGPPKLVGEGKPLPFIVLSPQCPAFQRWEVTQLDALLKHVEQTYKVDPDRICVTGLSLGGYGTWQLAANFPDRFAAIVPICGGGEKECAKQIAHIPTWVFHGGNDGAVPLRASAEMVKALEAAGGHPKFTIYPVADHDSWTETYANPELYEWLLQQKRQPRE
ncbi:MAG: prolyl oligopeptidase family serine peptidase [Planctomycetaceae bacterium]|nr:prolyl oligopeptidase family serine peptidase [Planctomycetaceae bacterium]